MKLHWAKPALRTWTEHRCPWRKKNWCSGTRETGTIHAHQDDQERAQEGQIRCRLDTKTGIIKHGNTQQTGETKVEKQNNMGTGKGDRTQRYRRRGSEREKERARNMESIKYCFHSVTTHTETQFSTQSYKNCSNCNLVLSLNEPSMNSFNFNPILNLYRCVI